MKKKLCKILASVLCLTMVLALAACGGNAGGGNPDAGISGGDTGSGSGSDTGSGSGGKKVIGVTLNHTQDVFMKNLESGVLAAAEANPDYTVKCVECGQDPAVQLSQVEQFIAEKVDVIVLNPANQEAAADAVEAAAEAGIPIMTVNTLTTDEAQAKCFTYVGSDATVSGRIQGEYVAENILNSSGKVAYMNATMGHQAQIDRRSGTMEVWEKYPDIEIVLEGSGEWSTEKGMELTENWLNSGKEFDVIVCQGADMAYGALLALEDAGKVGEIAVSGIDITDDTAAALKEGTIANLVFQDAIGQGKGAVEAAIAFLNGEKLDAIIDIPYELVTAENVDDYAGKY